MDLFMYVDLSSRLAMAISLRDMLLKAGFSDYSNFGDCAHFQLLINHLDVVIHNEGLSDGPT